jgi:hypothetical protein
VLVRIPDISDAKTVLTRLRKQNPELRTSDWSVMSRKVTEEQTLAFSIDPDSFKVLAKSNFKAFLGLGRTIFRTLKETKKHSEGESSTSKFEPQLGGLGCPMCCHEELSCCRHTRTMDL